MFVSSKGNNNNLKHNKMKVTKTQLKNGKFQYSVTFKGQSTVIINSSKKEFKQFVIMENFKGSISLRKSTSSCENLNSYINSCIKTNKHNSDYFNNKSMLKNKFHICKIQENSDTEILINGNSYDLVKELEATFGVKF